MSTPATIEWAMHPRPCYPGGVVPQVPCSTKCEAPQPAHDLPIPISDDAGPERVPFRRWPH